MKHIIIPLFAFFMILASFISTSFAESIDHTNDKERHSWMKAYDEARKNRNSSKQNISLRRRDSTNPEKTIKKDEEEKTEIDETERNKDVDNAESVNERSREVIIKENNNVQEQTQKRQTIRKENEKDAAEVNENEVESSKQSEELILDNESKNKNIEPTDVKPEYAVKEDLKQTLTTWAQQTHQKQLPKPMTYSKALSYQMAHEEDICVSDFTTKDKLGNKNVDRIFDLMGDGGFVNDGSSIVGVADFTSLRLYVNYGFETEKTNPQVVIAWGGNLEGAPHNGFSPTGLVVIFADGFEQRLALQGYRYNASIWSGLFVTTISHYFTGSIVLSDFELFEMTRHGNVVATHLSTSTGGMRHLFYSGNKNLEHKLAMTKGLKHAAIMMGLNEVAIANKAANIAEITEKSRKTSLRNKIKSEILNEQERNAIRKEVIEELRKQGLLKDE